MDWKRKNVLVIGCGISGIAAAELLENQGACPILFDENEKTDLEKIRQKLKKESKITILAGKLPKEIGSKVDYVVLSPGVPCDGKLISEFREKKVPILGEIELAYLCSKGKILAITGTNGKTTTTALCGKIIQEYFASSFIVGNIGVPYTKKVEEMTEESNRI